MIEIVDFQHLNTRDVLRPHCFLKLRFTFINDGGDNLY